MSEIVNTYLLNSPVQVVSVNSFIPNGNWSSSHTYAMGDVVSYNGCSFVSIVNANLNNTPVVTGSTSYWQLIASGFPTTVSGDLSGSAYAPTLAAQPYLFAQARTTQSLSANTSTAVVFSGNISGVAGSTVRGTNYPTVSGGNTFTINRAGMYNIEYAVTALASVTSGTLITSLTAGGILYKGSSNTNTTTYGTSMGHLQVALASGNTVQVNATASTASTVQMYSTSFGAVVQTYITIVRMSD